MNYLAIDTSGKNLTVVVCKDGKEFVFYDENCGVNHSVAVMSQTELLLEKAGISAKDMDFFAVVVGPGSFTGIRIGVATVKAFCFAYNKPCLAITSFDTISYNITDGKRIAVIDAKHDGYYVCGYDGDRVVYPPSYVNGATLTEIIKEGYRVLSYQPLSAYEGEVVRVDIGLIKAINSKLNEVTKDINCVKPLYIRKSQAEEGR